MAKPAETVIITKKTDAPIGQRGAIHLVGRKTCLSPLAALILIDKAFIAEVLITKIIPVPYKVVADNIRRMQGRRTHITGRGSR